MAREPTPEQKAKEAAIFYTALADIGNVTLQFVFALLTRSLALLSEAIRGALMTALEIYAYFVLRAVHRGRLGKLRFGVGQLEQMCNLAIGAGLVLSGLWIARQVVLLVVFDYTPATPLGLATAAVINAVNVVINSLGWLAMLSASRSDDSPIYSAQLRARTVKLLSCLFVQATMTIAALAKDPLISAYLDGLGAAFVGALMVAIGLKMVWTALPSLLDRSLSPEISERLGAILREAGVEPEHLVRQRTRRAGDLPQVELTLSAAGCRQVGDFLARAGRLEGRLRRELPAADITIALDTAGRPGGAPS